MPGNVAEGLKEERSDKGPMKPNGAGPPPPPGRTGGDTSPASWYNYLRSCNA